MITEFKGTFDRGRDDVVPKDHFIDSLNVRFSPRSVKTREGTIASIVLTVPGGETIVRHYFKRADGYGRILLYLTSGGNLYGVRNGITTLLLAIPAMLDFSITSNANYVFISPHTGSAGIVGERMYRWDGTNIRQSAGLRPAAGSAIAAATTGTGVNEVQTLTLTGTASAGNFTLSYLGYGDTVPLPFNFSAAQLQSALQGDNERQSVWLVGATGGTFTLRFGDEVSGPIDWNETFGALQTILEAVPNIGAGNIAVLSGDGTIGNPWLIRFEGSLAKQQQAEFIADGALLTGTTPQTFVEETLPGKTLFGVGNVTATGTGPWVITFIGDHGSEDIPLPYIDSNLTGATPVLTIVETTAGAPAGKIEAGKHKFAVAYETETGFITKPGPAIAAVFTPTIYEAPGDFKVNLSNIPLGPAGTTARIILATKANEEVYYFVPDGRIGDNTTTTLSNVSFFDAELVQEADYLFDLLETIPSCLNIIDYSSRVCLLGFPNPDGSLVRISRAGEPESFDEVEGLQVINRADQHNLKNGFVLRGILYLGKTLGWYGLQDNESEEPAFWPKAISIDDGVGAYTHGVSEIPNFIAGNTKDRVLVVDSSGLLFFDGVFRRPEITWKFHDVWKRVNKNYFDKIQIMDDPVNQHLYLNVPLGLGEIVPTAILYADYSDCAGLPNSKDTKWTVWDFPENPLSISCFDLNGKGNPIFRYSSSIESGVPSKIYRFCSAADSKNDHGTPIVSYIKTWLIAPGTSNTGQLNYFGFLRVRVEGDGNLDITYYGEDNLPVNVPPFLLISANPGKEFDRLTNFVAERLSIKIGVDVLNEWFDLYRLIPHAKVYAVRRPAS
jgi:hypothetical protein